MSVCVCVCVCEGETDCLLLPVVSGLSLTLQQTCIVSVLSSSKVSACSMLIEEFCGGKAGWNDRATFIETDFR